MSDDRAMSERPMDWNLAKEYFDEIHRIYLDMLGEPGVFVEPALRMVFEPLLRRYNAGERTRELYDAMMEVE